MREKILDVAEELFAIHGYDAVSTRAVAARVDVSAAMIHYYFTSKRALFDAVFARRAGVLNRERMIAFDSYEASVEQTVEGAIAAFLTPMLVKLAADEPGWRHYLALVALVGNTQEWGGAVITRSFDSVVERLIELIGNAMPDARPEDLYWGYHFLSGAVLLTFSGTDRIDRLSHGVCRHFDIDAILPRMVEFAAAGFRRVCTEQLIQATPPNVPPGSAPGAHPVNSAPIVN